MKILFKHTIILICTWLICSSAIGQSAIVRVDSIFINPGSIKKFNAVLYPNDTITKGFKWYINGNLKLNNDSMKGFTDTIYKDTWVKAIPITYQGVLGDTFTVKVVTNIPDRVKWFKPYLNDCLPVDTTYNNIPVSVSLVGYKPDIDEQFKIIYDIENKDSVVLRTDTLESAKGISTIKDTIITKQLGLGNFSMRIKHLYYGVDEGNHIDLSTIPVHSSNKPKKIELQLIIGVTPKIIDIEY
jgi:hypothetical protein